MSESNSATIRFREIANRLREQILSGHYGKTGRMPSEAQLVEIFGVSRPTIARALAMLGDEDLVERRAGSGTYVKAERSAKSSSNLLGLLVPSLSNTEIFQLICGEIASLARVHNYSVVWGGSDVPQLDPELSLRQSRDVCLQFINQKVAGVFFAPNELVRDKDERNRELAVMLREAGIPVVLLDRDLTRFPLRSDFDLVGIDNFGGGFMLAEHLLKLGCTRIHFVSRPMSAPSVDARIAGVREALGRAGIVPDKNWLRIGDLSDKKFVRSLTGPVRPEAYICANDHTAALLLRELHANNVRVPKDVRVVGFDDVKYATLVTPPLTTVQQPCQMIAAAALRAMLSRKADPLLPPNHFTVAPRLVIRDSCGAYLPHAERA